MDTGDSGFSNGLTAMQHELLERQRAGEDVEMRTSKLPDGSRKVEIVSKGQLDLPSMSPEEAASAFSDVDVSGEALPSLEDVLAQPEEPDTKQTPVSPAPAVPPAVPDPHVCERCGHKYGDPIYAPTATDKQFFVEATFGDKPFEKVFEFMGGGMHVHCTAPNRQSLDVAFRLLQWCFSNDKLTLAVDEKEYYTRIHVAMTVDSLSYGDKVKQYTPLASTMPWTKMNTEDFSAMFDAVVARVEEFGARYPFVALATAQFLGVYNELITHALDENFWIGVSQA